MRIFDEFDGHRVRHGTAPDTRFRLLVSGGTRGVPVKHDDLHHLRELEEQAIRHTVTTLCSGEVEKADRLFGLASFLHRVTACPGEREAGPRPL